MVWEQSPPTQTPSKQFHYSFLAKRRQIQTYSLHVICLATPVLLVFVVLAMGSPLCVSEQWEAESRIMERKWCSPSCQSRAGAHQCSLLTPVQWVSRDSQPSSHSTHRAEQAQLLYCSNNCSHRPSSECCYFSTPQIWKPQVLISNAVFLRKKWYIQMHSKAWALTKRDYPPLYFHFTFLLIFHICSVLSDKFYFYLHAFSCSQSNWSH